MLGAMLGALLPASFLALGTNSTGKQSATGWSHPCLIPRATAHCGGAEGRGSDHPLPSALAMGQLGPVLSIAYTFLLLTSAVSGRVCVCVLIQPHQPAHCRGWGSICATEGQYPPAPYSRGQWSLPNFGENNLLLLPTCLCRGERGRVTRRVQRRMRGEEHMYSCFSEQPQGAVGSGAGGAQASPGCPSTEHWCSACL